jgi:hypothetical protein
MQARKKGQHGYRDYKKKVEILRTILYFAIVAAIFLLGYSQTHSKKNLLTVVAVVGCLPASKALVGVVVRLPYKSISTSFVEIVEATTTHITALYDLILTSSEKVLPIDCIVISGTSIFGYTHHMNIDLEYVANHIRQMLLSNQIEVSSIKFFQNETAFLARAEGLDRIAAVEGQDNRPIETEIANLILTLSM